MSMIAANEFEKEIASKLEAAYLVHPNHSKFVGTDKQDLDARMREVVARMGANHLLWDLQFPEVRQYLRYILARSDIDWTYVDHSTED